MIIDKSATSRMNAADRRADDTHWWNAYRLNSTVVSTIGPPKTNSSRGTFSPYSVFEPGGAPVTGTRFDSSDATDPAEPRRSE